MLGKFFLIVSILLLNGIAPFRSYAGDDKSDSLTLVAKKRANRVALMSAIIPGAGQIANKKYWKVPVIYGGGLVLAYFIKTNNDEYKKYQQARVYRIDNDSTTVDAYPQFTDQDLKAREDYYRRNRDLSYIFAGVFYVLNIIDAYVDSQLMDFDVSDNLSLRINPTINSTLYNKPVPSLNLVFSFK
jgi:hypothetical protein